MFGVGIGELTLAAVVAALAVGWQLLLPFLSWDQRIKTRWHRLGWGTFAAFLAAVMVTPADPVSTLIVAPVFVGFFAAGLITTPPAANATS